uniref:F-box/kelch-repeat protein At3g23880-like n=1 Tax=Erigeron canadensis TaxID=72917 RepID=UPI001CB90D7A|nr:F-box/kelch-repeat protein At3g23880-like [Erigeron canadensis]
MAEVVPDDILEKIFLRLEVKDIIQCKSVCKSWFSVISSSGFINSHLKHNYNNTTQRTRISIGDDGYNNLVGSSNGLVCIFNSGPKLCVLNPCLAGILCNGSLHWLMRDQNHNTVILSFHLSKEEFKEIPTPAHHRCEYSRLGIIQECLCICGYSNRDHLMKNYDDKQSWELLPPLPQWDRILYKMWKY